MYYVRMYGRCRPDTLNHFCARFETENWQQRDDLPFWARGAVIASSGELYTEENQHQQCCKTGQGVRSDCEVWNLLTNL